MNIRHKFVSMSLVMLLSSPAFSASTDRLAFISSEGDNNVMVVDLKTEKTIKIIPTGKTPHAMAFTKEGKVFVNNRGSKDITVIDANSLAVLDTIALPATSFQLALSPDEKTLVVAYKDALMLTFIDTASGKIIRSVAVGKEPPATFKGVMMLHPYWADDGKHVYAPDVVNGVLAKVEVATGNLVETIALNGSTHYIHPSKNGKLLFAVNGTNKAGTSLTVIDGATDKIIKDIPIPLAEGEKGLGHHGAFSPDGKLFYFCNEGGKTVAVIDTAKLEVVKAIAVGQGAGHPTLTKDGRHLLIVHHRDNVISVIDTATLETVKNIPVGSGKKQAHSAYVTPDGHNYYMLNAEDNLLTKIDLDKMAVISTLPVGKSAMYFGIKEGDSYPPTE